MSEGQNQFDAEIESRVRNVSALGAAVRTALAEQIVLGGSFNIEQVAQTVRDRIVDPVCALIVAGIRERLGEVVGNGLAESVRSAVSETQGGPSLGVH